jgi:hypothetical protein
MFTVLAMLAAAPLNAPSDQMAGQLRSAIWYDLQVNAMIGNGNWLASLWYNAGSENTPNLPIQNLRCDGGTNVLRCSFTLFRDGGVAKVLGEEAPDKLACDATFIRPEDGTGWAVKHIPPKRAGHSQTTMRCKAAST